jgi:hypothetical protein
MNGEFDLEPFTEALREDLPHAADEARLRARLVSAGVLAGVGVVTPSATATAATSGLVSKVVVLPFAVKVGVTLILASAVIVPLVRARGGVGERAATSAAQAMKQPPSPRTAVATRVAGAPRTVGSAAVPLIAPATSSPGQNAPSTPAPGENVDAPERDARPSAASAREAASGMTAAVPRARGANGAAETFEGGRATPSSVETAESAPSVPEAAPAAQGVASFPVISAPVLDEGTLRAETALMEQALAAMKRGDLVTARRALAEHTLEFPNGHLAPERERALARIREKERTP